MLCLRLRSIMLHAAGQYLDSVKASTEPRDTATIVTDLMGPQPADPSIPPPLPPRPSRQKPMKRPRNRRVLSSGPQPTETSSANPTPAALSGYQRSQSYSTAQCHFLLACTFHSCYHPYLLISLYVCHLQALCMSTSTLALGLSITRGSLHVTYLLLSATWATKCSWWRSCSTTPCSFIASVLEACALDGTFVSCRRVCMPSIAFWNVNIFSQWASSFASTTDTISPTCVCGVNSPSSRLLTSTVSSPLSMNIQLFFATTNVCGTYSHPLLSLSLTTCCRKRW